MKYLGTASVIAFSGANKASLKYTPYTPAVVSPGSGFSGATTRSDIDGGGSYTKAGTSTAVAWWTEHPVQVVGSTYGDTLDVGIVADHYNDIEKVGFIADNGTEVFVTSPTTVNSVEQYRITLDMSSKAAGDTVEVRAIAYPYHGRPRILQGELQTDTSVADTNKQGFYSLKCTKISSIQTVNVSSGTLVDAINGLGDLSASTAQHKLVFSEGSFEAGEAVCTFGVGPIPLIIEGTGNRATTIQQSTQYNSGRFDGSYHLRNLNWIVTSVPLRKKSSAASYPCYFYAEDCNLTADWEYVSENYVHTDSSASSVAITSNNTGNDLSGTKLLYDFPYRNGNLSLTVSSSSDQDTYGIWLDTCALDCELGDRVYWIKNCTAPNLISDAFHGGCMLNCQINDAQFGFDRVYVLTTEILNWQASTAFADSAKVLVFHDSAWRIYQNFQGATIPGSTTFDPADGWTDIAPHGDGWQARVSQDGSNTFENIWLEGLSTNALSVIQPHLFRQAETLIGCVWKNWNIQNKPGSSLLTQVHTHMDHWIVDSCTWWDENGTGQENSGDLFIRWQDHALSDVGWGNTDATGSTIGCRNARWKNSSIRDFTISNEWPGYDTIYTVQDFVADINGRSGWDLALDAFTLANSSLGRNIPAAVLTYTDSNTNTYRDLSSEHDLDGSLANDVKYYRDYSTNGAVLFLTFDTAGAKTSFLSNVNNLRFTVDSINQNTLIYEWAISSAVDFVGNDVYFKLTDQTTSTSYPTLANGDYWGDQSPYTLAVFT